MEGRGRGGRGQGRGRAPGQQGGHGRGRAHGPGGGQGRGRGLGHQEPPQVFGAPENLLNVFGVSDNLLNQNPEIDQLNEELSSNYTDIQSMRDAIAQLRQVVPNDQPSHEKYLEVCLDEYRDMRSRCAYLRNSIRRMNPPGIPFEEPEGFSVMP